MSEIIVTTLTELGVRSSSGRTALGSKIVRWADVFARGSREGGIMNNAQAPAVPVGPRAGQVVRRRSSAPRCIAGSARRYCYGHHGSFRVGQVDSAALHVRNRQARLGSNPAEPAGISRTSVRTTAAASDARRTDSFSIGPTVTGSFRRSRTSLCPWCSTGCPSPKPSGRRTASSRHWDWTGCRTVARVRCRVGSRNVWRLRERWWTKPAVLFADEPTGALDAQTSWEVMRVLRDSAQQIGSALVVVTRRCQKSPRWCDRTMMMQAGSLVGTQVAA